jgi:hypothetical protein
MSKQINGAAPASPRPVRRHLACVFFISLAACVLAIAPAQFAFTQEPANTAAARNAALIAATDEVLKETSTIRQLTVLRPVQSSTQSRAEIERAVVKNLDEDTSAADIHAVEATLKKLGLVPPDFQYRALMIRLLTEQVAGYYEPKTRQFHLADWIDLDAQRPVMAHELTHALQDQHFNLRRFEHWPKGDSDAELAAHALVEGDASAVMLAYVSQSPARMVALMKSMTTTPVATEEINKAPRALRETLLFPYLQGMQWTQALYRQGGWPLVSEAFQRLPQSTEQIIHPEKYFGTDKPLEGQKVLNPEPPLKVALPDFTKSVPSATGASKQTPAAPVLDSSWHRIDDDVQGEWGLYLLLDTFLKSPEDSRRAAAGWGGDRYDVYESSSGRIIYVSSSAWDTPADAREFFDAYRKRVDLRYAGAQATRLLEATDRSTASISWKTDEGAVALDWSGSHVFIIEGCPDSVDANRLMSMLMP